MSHGWCRLLPFDVDSEASRLRGVIALEEGGAAGYRVSARGNRIVVESPGPSNAAVRRQLRAAIRRILNLDFDLSGLHRAISSRDDLSWIVRSGSGRLLRSATMFEDLVKLVLTTNCSWAFTTKMVAALVEGYGERAPDGSRAFPGPQAIAGAGARELRAKVRAGYRAPLLARLAREVAEGRIDPEAWGRDTRDTETLREEMLTLPGVGPYVADNLLRLLGRPSGLGLDSWLRAKYARVYHGGRPVTDRTIVRRYARLGRWGGLVFWFDMTRDWFDDDKPSEACTTLS